MASTTQRRRFRRFGWLDNLPLCKVEGRPTFAATFVARNRHVRPRKCQFSGLGTTAPDLGLHGDVVRLPDRLRRLRSDIGACPYHHAAVAGWGLEIASGSTSRIGDAGPVVWRGPHNR